MRKITLTVYCDACTAQGSPTELGETEAVSVKLAIYGGARREMDLCSSCLADFVNMSREDTEAKVKPKRKTGRTWTPGKDYGYDSDLEPQPWTCGQCEASFTAEQGVKIHLGLAH